MATKRTWTIKPVVDEYGNKYVDQDGLAELLNDLMGTMRAIGGQFQVAAMREEVAPDSDEGVTIGYAVMYDTYVPMKRSQRPAPVEEPMPGEVDPESALEPVEA